MSRCRRRRRPSSLHPGLARSPCILRCVGAAVLTSPAHLCHARKPLQPDALACFGSRSRSFVPGPPTKDCPTPVEGIRSFPISASIRFSIEFLVLVPRSQPVRRVRTPRWQGSEKIGVLLGCAACADVLSRLSFCSLRDVEVQTATKTVVSAPRPG